MITGVNPQLSDNLQRATEGSRELDYEIARFIGWSYDDYDGVWINPQGARGFEAGDIPRWTTNLQDAVSLLKGGEEYEVSTLYGIAYVALPLNTNDPDGPYEARREDGDVCLAFCECYIKASSKAEAA